MPALVKNVRSAKIPAKLRKQVVQSKGTSCHYCGKFVDKAMHLDHVVPFSRGGETTYENLVPACKFCNIDKLSMTVEEWRSFRESRGMSWPPPNTDKAIEEYMDALVRVDHLTFWLIVGETARYGRTGHASAEFRAYHRELGDYMQKRYNEEVDASAADRYAFALTAVIGEVQKAEHGDDEG